MSCSIPLLHSVLHHFLVIAIGYLTQLTGWRELIWVLRLSIFEFCLGNEESSKHISLLVIPLAPVSLSLNKFHAYSFLFPFHISFPFPLSALGALNKKVEDSLFSSVNSQVYLLQFYSTNREEIAIAYEYKSVSAEKKLFVLNQIRFSKMIVWSFCIAFGVFL